MAMALHTDDLSSDDDEENRNTVGRGKSHPSVLSLLPSTHPPTPVYSRLLPCRAPNSVLPRELSFTALVQCQEIRAQGGIPFCVRFRG